LTTPTKNEVEQDSQSLQRQILYLKEENERLKRHADKLSFAVMDKEKKNAALQQYEYNFRKVNEQKVALESINRDHCGRISTLLSEKEQTKKVLEELHCAQKEKQEALDETAVLYTQFEALKKIYAEGQEQLDLYNEQRLAVDRELAELQSKADRLEDCQKQLEALQEKEVQYAKAQDELNEARKLLLENQRLQDDCRHAVAAQDDAEVRLRVAQQHLAKKVKETSELNDKLHGLEFRFQELQRDLDQIRMRSAEQQTALDGHVQAERRLQEKLQEAARSADTTAAKWEDKYFKIYEKWQNNEMRLKELKKLEEKHAQMQALLTSFGSLFGGAVTNGPAAFPSIPVPCLQSEIKQAPPNQYLYEDGMDSKERGNTDIQADKEDKSYARPYQNLFDMPRQLKRPKETLFE
jgi:chromosome segregation ATPase